MKIAQHIIALVIWLVIPIATVYLASCFVFLEWLSFNIIFRTFTVMWVLTLVVAGFEGARK